MGVLRQTVRETFCPLPFLFFFFFFAIHDSPRCRLLLFFSLPLFPLPKKVHAPKSHSSLGSTPSANSGSPRSNAAQGSVTPDRSRSWKRS